MSKEEIKITKEDLVKARSIADTYAKSRGKESIDELINPIREGLNSEDPVQNEISLSLARSAVEDLTKLILRQELFTVQEAEYINFVDVFNDGTVKEGNAKNYVFNNPTGKDTYARDDYVSTATTATDVDTFSIKMYNDTGKTLSNQGYQFRKPVVYIGPEWIPYFKSGNLTGFIADLQKNIYLTWKMFIFDKIMNLIKNGTYKKAIQGTAANCFDAWTNEILPTIREMTTYSADFNYNSANTNLMFSNPSDLLVFAHPKTIQTLQSGIKSQLFNAKLLDLKGLVDAENFINAGKELNIQGPNVKITAKASYYVDVNTIFVINKAAIRHFTQIDTIESMFYGKNLAMEFTMHKWGALDFLPWGQCFKYTNTNLNTLP